MKTKVETFYRVEMDRETTECLLALIFCNLCYAEDSPLDGLSRRLQNVLNLDDDGMTRLAKRYSEFV